jgi:diguanylate cyclase (GGDEF)-like protein/PAS domain S-box-containing protein
MPNLPTPAELLDLLPDAVCLVDADGRFVYTNAGFGRLLGYGTDELRGRAMADLIHPEDREATLAQARRVMQGAGERHFRNRYVHREGHGVDLLWSAQWLPEHGLRIGVAREIGELRRAERELEYRAHHDPLTGLANRLLLEQRIAAELDRAQRRDGSLALLYVDLDGFKQVHDRGGHEAGDRILREVARRLERDLRHQDLVARVGGDEFVVLLPGSGAAEARREADALRARLLVPCTLREGELLLDASVGIACGPEEGTDAATLLAAADRAMYASRRQRALGGGASAP